LLVTIFPLKGLSHGLDAKRPRLGEAALASPPGGAQSKHIAMRLIAARRHPIWRGVRR
jgi:hypothetical protein